MLLFKRIKDIQSHLKIAKKEGKAIGFVPTMGALHQGHLSLIEKSRRQCDLTVCSIFVNPTQFNEKSDFDKYPVTISADMEKLNDARCDVLFLPSVKEMYPRGFKINKEIDFGFIAQTLEGEHRPGHFAGMAQVVELLLRIVKPDKLYMGQKDYQQQLIVKKIIKKRNFKTGLVICETLREKDGLAMSSRNVRLDAQSRKLAVEISATLKKTKFKVQGSRFKVRNLEQDGLRQLSNIIGIEPEYFAIRNAETLKPVVAKSEKMVALTAVKIGGVRLIDNMIIN